MINTGSLLMPKQVWKIERFESGLNNSSDPRDIDDTELSGCVDSVVHNKGRIRLMGSFGVHDAPTNSTTTKAGYGLFYFPSDRVGAQLTSTDFDGTQSYASNNQSFLTDPSADWANDELIGMTINNITKSSSATITDNTDKTVTGTLSGGTDWDNGDEYSITNFTDTGEHYLLMADTSSAANIDVYTYSLDAWKTAVIDLGGTTGMKPTYYVADGNLRISDGNFGAANQNKWYGYIKSTHFNGVSPGGVADTYDRWYTKAVDLAKPTRGLYGDLQWTDSSGNATTTNHPTSTAFAGMHDELDDNNDYIALSISGGKASALISTADDDTLTTASNSDGGGWSGEAMRLYPSAGKGFNVSIETSSNGTWREGDYEVGTTFIYQGEQESNIFENVGNGVEMNSGQGWSVYIQCTSPFDPFIIGGRAYIRKKDSDDPWTLLLDISLKNGVRKNLTSTYTVWSIADIDTAIGSLVLDTNLYVGNIEIEDPSPWTYEAINGYRADESIDIGALGEGFKTAVVANRQVYVGNIRRELEGGTFTQGDAIYKSMPGKFDTFPISRKIEASIQDGDEIIKLEEYADRLLQFKKSKMHLINISQDMEFLEDTFMHKGVPCPGAVCKTDFGIVWANKVGAYFYDGKAVNNLLEKRGNQVISGWSDFIGSDPQVGYIAKHRQVIFTMSADATPAGDIYLFDMITQSWVYGDSKVTDTDLQSNFINDINEDLVYHEEGGAVYKWSDTAVASSKMNFMTKDIDFGDPSRRKKVYKVYVSYKGDASNVEAKYADDGNTTISGAFHRTNADGSTTGSHSGDYKAFYQGAVGTNDWVNAELKPTSSINNVKSFRFQLKASGSVSADFEINDITIVYRMKGIK